MKNHHVIILVSTLEFLAFAGLMWWHGETIRVETERSILNEVGNDHVRRGKTNNAFVGYAPWEKECIEEVAGFYGLSPALLAAIGRNEYGAMQHRTGVIAWCSPHIKKTFENPRCWPWAMTAELILRNWARYDQKPDELGPHLVYLAKQYNLNWEQWSIGVASFMSSYSAGEDLEHNPCAKESGPKPRNGRKKT